jgi:hypothetical protein
VKEYCPLFLTAITFITFLATPGGYAANPKDPALLPLAIQENGQFRNEVVRFVRRVAEDYLSNRPPEPQAELAMLGNWYLTVSIYREGLMKGRGIGNERSLNAALWEAVQEALRNAMLQPLSQEELASARFLIAFHYPPDRSFAIIEYGGKGKELVGDIVPVREMNKGLVRLRIEASKRYLLRTMHPELHGFYKKYDAHEDKFGQKLYTIYSASSLYTLLKIYDLDNNPEIEKNIKLIADFLLSMQQREGENTGAFHYAYYVDSGEKERRFSVGTASKTIFTLLELHRRLQDPKYLGSAKLAGDWLLKMQHPDGSVSPHATFTDGKWHYEKKDSFLYTGQVLSALSRLYRVTGEKRYYEGAGRIAQGFIGKVEEQGIFLGDDFRPPNTISTSWVAMALMDYAEINPDRIFRDIVFRCIDEILVRRINNPSDVYNHGRFYDTHASSGNGWINEVMVEVYKLCREEGKGGCDRYQDAIVQSSRWLIQNVYSEENVYHIKNPVRVIGGFIRNFTQESVRTDAVCHGVNSLIGLLEITGEGILISVPERPFEEVINLLRLGTRTVSYAPSALAARAYGSRTNPTSGAADRGPGQRRWREPYPVWLRQ